MRKKICIGYVLKSADVKTQVSISYSENSFHTYPQALTDAHTRAHPHTSMHTHMCPHISTHIPHIPARGLNLINHMELYINRPNIKRGER